ncbi:peptide-methionine (R)-S-oxide reductase MsrB [Enterovirga sp.]|uniref:peptide-methionine (R)-S-oxide reductase MsrB n=1 Tax=Enterovirga sp. TaxID=2026350 RepID=UPI002CE69B27|nr:peptide-methionine (R)-S-oxide reductase MsrB [Enterovirga sp.]HMO27859.1 peptide-methionine (R)-S-oxide reductase MsrB [Enterovirga sp.]
MLTRRVLMLSGVAGLAAVWLRPDNEAGAAEVYAVSYSDDEWRRRLTPQQYAVLRREGTERPYSSPLNDEHRRGSFSCAGCDNELFSSSAKFESGTGWPSFWAPLAGAVGETRDMSYGMVRKAVHCARCGGHLGHVFDDGPKPTGLRYCMNGVAMTFKPLPA